MSNVLPESAPLYEILVVKDEISAHAHMELVVVVAAVMSAATTALSARQRLYGVLTVPLGPRLFEPT